jgi:hypothetical protein
VSDRRISPAGAVVLAVVVGVGFWLGGRTPGAQADRTLDDAAMTAREATLTMGADAGVVALPVRTLDGTVTSLARSGAGAPVVVMVSSETCTFCKEALREMGRISAGRPLGRLRLVTLEGAEVGAPMARAAGVQGAVLAGPVTRAAEALFSFQIRGTPTFVALDSAGRVTRSLVGYPGAESFRPWIDVMLGARDTP